MSARSQTSTRGHLSAGDGVRVSVKGAKTPIRVRTWIRRPSVPERFQNPGSCRGSVFVDEAAKQIVAFDLRLARSNRCVSRFGRDERERTMRPLRVVVGHVVAKRVFEVAAAEDQQPVKTLGADGAYEPLGVGVRLWRPIGVWITLLPSLRNTSSKLAVSLLSRSWISNSVRSRRPLKLRLRACWVTQAPVGLGCSRRGGRAGFRVR
jgi:hypothetical protein